MSELQNDEYVEENTETEVVEDQEIESELAPDSEAEHEQKPEVVEEDAIQKKFNKLTFERHESERKAKAAEQRAAELEQKEREREQASIGEIPPMPDYLDDNYEELIKARDEAIVRKAQFTAQQTFQQRQYEQQTQAQQAKKAEENAQAVRTHNERVSSMGIKAEEMQKAEGAVLTYGLQPECLEHIIKDSESPLIIKHLAANPQDGIELAGMSPYSQGLFLAEIKQKAAALKPKKSNAPPPPENITGGSADPEAGKYKNIAGAKFE